MQTGNFTFTARSIPECESFLKLKYQDNSFLKIDKFFENTIIRLMIFLNNVACHIEVKKNPIRTMQLKGLHFLKT